MSLVVIKNQIMKMYGGVEEYLHSFLISALHGSVWAASRPRPLYPRRKNLGTHCTGGWVDRSAGLKAVATRKCP
jgi:hypothetical protein